MLGRKVTGKVTSLSFTLLHQQTLIFLIRLRRHSLVSPLAKKTIEKTNCQAITVAIHTVIFLIHYTSCNLHYLCHFLLKKKIAHVYLRPPFL